MEDVHCLSVAVDKIPTAREEQRGQEAADGGSETLVDTSGRLFVIIDLKCKTTLEW